MPAKEIATVFVVDLRRVPLPTRPTAARQRRQWDRKPAIAREHERAGGQDEQMGDGKRGGLLREGEWEFPNQNDSGIDENRERPVLKFAGKIAADPRVGAEQWKMTFAPAPRDIGEHRQDRQFIIVVPKKERIVPEKDGTKRDDN